LNQNWASKSKLNIPHYWRLARATETSIPGPRSKLGSIRAIQTPASTRLERFEVRYSWDDVRLGPQEHLLYRNHSEVGGR